MSHFKLIDNEKIKDYYGKDMDIFIGYVKKLQSSLPLNLNKLEDAIKNKDLDQARRLSHDFVALTASVFAQEINEKATNLENKFKSEMIDEKTIELFFAFRSSLTDLNDDLNQLIYLNLR